MNLTPKGAQKWHGALMHTTEIRERITNLHGYARLQAGLEPGDGGARNPEIRKVLDAVGEFLRTASQQDLRNRGPQLEGLLRKTTTIHPHLKPLRAPEAIGVDFINLEQSYDILRYGIVYEWLVERFGVPILALPLDLPMHSRIGLGPHAGSVAIEESTLLDDAFLLLSHTRRAYEQMITVAKSLEEPGSASQAQQVHDVLTHLNENVATFARLVVVTIAAFIEALINSVGSSEVLRRPSLESKVAEQLKGTRDNRYLSLEFKMERFPALIRSDGQSPLRVIDEKQRIEPFRRFLAETKSVRDASMHFGPSKEAIICTPQEWVRRADNSVADAMGVARAFWAACYPNSPAPTYLYNLELTTFVDRAAKRVRAGESVRS